MKKYLTLLLILSLLGILFACSKTSGNYDPTSKKIIIETNSTDLKDISKLIFQKYLDEFKKDNVLRDMKLKNYKVGEIHNVQGNDTGFEFYVNYSVNPSATTAYWIAGNAIEKGTWVNDKSLFVVVEKVDNGYTIKDMGTGK